MAQEHLNQIIGAAGLSPEDVQAILAIPEGAEDFKAEDYTGRIRESVETQVRNDPKFWESLDENNVHEDFRKKIESQQYGRAANIVRQKALKALGLKEDDLGEMSDEDKKSIETYIGRAAEKFAATKVTDKQLQADLVAARKKVEELEAKFPELETQFKQDYEQKFNDKTLDVLIYAKLAEVENLTVPAKYLIDRIATELKQEHAFVIDGINAVPKQKANPALDVLDGSKALSLKDLIMRKLEADKLIAKSDDGGGRQNGRVTVPVNPDNKGGLAISSHVMEKIQAMGGTES